MLKRPTSRRKSGKEEIVLNLVPILDTMVTLIGFLLFTSSFISIVGIESPFPESSAARNEQLIKEKPLQLTLTLGNNEARIWSPFDKVAARTIANASPGQPDVKAIHDALLEVKKLFPEESSLVIAPSAGVTYDVLVSVMDSVRGIETTDAPIFFKNAKTGVDEAVKKLFPDIIFGNLLSTGEGDE